MNSRPPSTPPAPLSLLETIRAYITRVGGCEAASCGSIEHAEDCRYCAALASLADLREQLQRDVTLDFLTFYADVDQAEKFDTNAGDSAVSCVLVHWAERHAALLDARGDTG